MSEFKSTCVLDQPPQAAVPVAPPEIELLLCCARMSIDSNTLDRFRTLLRQDLDWQRLIQTAGVHGVLPLLYHSLSRNASGLVPKAILDRLREDFRSNVQRNLLLTAELLKLLDLFAIHGITAIPFKGPVLAALVYEDLSLRQFSDLDVLVHRRDILKAQSVLASQGYQSDAGNRVAQESRPDPENVAYFGPKFYTFIHQDHGTRVDLQWRVAERYFSFSLGDNHESGKLVLVTVAGKPVLTFAPRDLLLILCVHGTKHQWQELKWICDVAELVRSEKEKLDWRKLQTEASRQGARRVLKLGLFLARDLLGAELPVEVSKAVEREFGGTSVGSRIVSKLLTGSIEPYSDFEKVTFYLKMMDGWQDRVQFCFRYLSQCLRAIATPSSKEREFLSLPDSLTFLYYFFRPLRLTAKYLWLALSRPFRGRP